MILATGLAFALALLATAQEPDEPSLADDAATRLAFMKRSLTLYDIHRLDAGSASFRLQAEPIFRMNNPVGGVKDGTIFFWLGADGRPEATVQAFLIPNGAWLHEFTSLSTEPFVAEVGPRVAWGPRRGGVTFEPIPDAPEPAAMPEARLRQMRTLAGIFSAEDYFEEKDWYALRLLSKPLARYGKPGTAVEDGALFSLALGTDPDVFLLIESRDGRWQYAFAPMTAYAVKGAWKGRIVWELPWRKYAKESSEPFYIRNHSREN